MQFTTQLIVGLIVATVLIGILITLYVKIFARPSTPSSDGCQPGTTNTLGVGCSACPDASCASCTADGDCQNGGTCKMFGSGSKGVCVCPKPYSGLKCETQCLSNSDCPSGSCMNGTCNLNTGACTTANCQPPNCDLSTCPKCADGWASDPSDPGKKCGICAPGRGPAGDCSKKLFTTPIQVSTNACGSGWHPWDADSWCKQQFTGNASGVLNNNVPGQCNGPSCAAGASWPLCNIPKYYASPNFDPSTWNSCPDYIAADGSHWSSYKAFYDNGMIPVNSSSSDVAIPRLNKFRM